MYIHLSVKTKQKSEELKLLKENYFEISVKEKPQNNMANKRILDILREYFDANKIKIINGHKSPKKLILVEKE